VRDFCFPALRAGAVYEGRYLLGTSLARPLIASRQVWAAERTHSDALAHGCTGKGNDQVRFELTYMALAPHLPVIAPWREWDITSREEALAYAQGHNVPVAQKPTDLYSRDANLWHLSHEGGALEDPANAPPEAMHKLTASPDQWPAMPEKITVGFERGRPVSVNGKTLGPVELLTTLNQLAGRHGVGRADVVESRLVGMKSRGVYETPGGTVLHEALDDLCRLVLPHDLLRTRLELGTRYADLVYNGLWFSPLRRALQSFADTALEVRDGRSLGRALQGPRRGRRPHEPAVALPPGPGVVRHDRLSRERRRGLHPALRPAARDRRPARERSEERRRGEYACLMRFGRRGASPARALPKKPCGRAGSPPAWIRVRRSSTTRCRSTAGW
jgi:argininosuccinate synthase